MHATSWQCRDRTFDLARGPLVMGVLNVTPDSFSDGGRWSDPVAAVARAHQMVAEGADLVRARQPVAGIFVVADGADPQRAHAPDGALDGVLPRGMDGDFVHGFLRANYTRPLVWVENHLLRAAGFEGDPHQNWIGAYFAQLGRTLCARAEREAAVAPDVAIDLRSVPADGDRAAALIATVRDHLDALGAAPVFTVTPELRKALAPREEIKRAVIVESP